jgi:glucosamine--fructose-6-phosphate aminotransferase (isomerizing)
VTFDAELREQPDVLTRLLAAGREPARAVAEAARSRGSHFAVLAARGTSDNAARYGQYLFGVRNRMVVALAAPSILTRYEAAPRFEGGLVVGISQSGQSPDIVAVVAEARRQGAVTLGVTNDAASPLAEAAELVFPLLAGPERSVAATKTYTAELMALALVSEALDPSSDAAAALAALPEQVAEAIETGSETAAVAARYRHHRRLLVLGRGYNLSTAFEIALKIKETCGVMADPYSSADFLHGPVALLERDVPVVLVAPAVERFADLEEVAALAVARKAPLVAISSVPALLEAAEARLPLPAGVPEWLSPMVAVAPGQLFAQALAVSRGLSADAPAGLTKVTLTR